MTKPYTTATACADAVDLAMNAVGMAANLALAGRIPLLHRLNEVAVALQQIHRDAEALSKQSQRTETENGA
jgi:hypothetical protein